MALRNQANAAPAPAFESDDLVDQPAKEEAATIPQNLSVAVPASQGGAVSSPLTKGTVMHTLQDAISTDELEMLGFGVLPRITIGLDGLNLESGASKELGKRAAIEVISWSVVWKITTGEPSTNTEANKLIRSSYDNVRIAGEGGTVADYMEFLKEEGYDKAKSKQCADLFVNLIWSEVGGDVAPEDRELIQVSLSPQSLKQWGGYMLNAGLRKRQGVQDSAIVTMTQEKRMFNSNKYGIATFQAGLKK